MPHPTNTRLSWTAAENTLLRTHYPTQDATALSPLLRGRTEMAIWKQARKLGIVKLSAQERKQAQKALPANAPAYSSKEPEPKAGIAAYMRSLPFLHPERLAYLNATKPGSPAGSAPRTVQQLKQLAATSSAPKPLR